ncbi:MAG: hypothetical protein QF464_11920, partial [Myxococcota bacterium]|nr:hypothetical protein [Myxococcota bacterium]
MDPTLLGFALALVLFVALARVIVKRSGPQDADEIAPSSPAPDLPAGDGSAVDASSAASEDAAEPDGHTLYEGLSRTRSEGFIGRISRLFAADK